jgi:hypothetical protein
LKEKLQIAVLLDNNNYVPSWEYQILKSISDSDYSKIVLVIRDRSDYSSVKKKKKSIANCVNNILETSDKFLFRGSYDYDLKKNVTGLFADIPELVINPADDSIPANTINEINSFNLDIILKFGFHILENYFFEVPKYGIWVFSIDNPESYKAIRSGFLEVVRKYPVTNSSLLIIKEDPSQTEIIFSSRESTCPYSININRNNVFWRATLFIPRIMSGIHKYGDDYLNVLKGKHKALGIDEDRFMQSESLLTPAHRIINYFTSAIRSVYKKIFYTDAFSWKLLFDINQERNSYSTNFDSFKEILPPVGFFWADPFIIAENDSFYIFVEEFNYKTDKAHISVLKLDINGNLLSSEKIIEKSYHMSYPFVFRIESDYYMIPETCENKTIELYKCTEFPYRWEFDRNIMENISAVDTTLFYHNNKWWLFTSIDQTKNHSGTSTELFLFFSDNIFANDWKSHPLNPIVSDIRTARPAGKLFIHNGEIYRPSQDCSVRYGKGFNINRVTRLNDLEYEENVDFIVEPIWDKQLKGTHTFNSDKNSTIIDVYSFRKRIRI